MYSRSKGWRRVCQPLTIGPSSKDTIDRTPNKSGCLRRQRHLFSKKGEWSTKLKKY